MILAFLTFSFGLWQVLTLRYVHSEKVRFIVGITAICMSAIPLIIQFLSLVDELRRAKQHFPRLLLHRFLMNIFGEYGPALNLVAKYYNTHRINFKYVTGNRLKIPSLPEFLPEFSAVFGAVTFGDAFSGMYNTRRVSTALWLDEKDDQWGLPVDGELEWAEKRWEEIKLREIMGLKFLRFIQSMEVGVDVEGGGDGVDGPEQMNRWNDRLRWAVGWLKLTAPSSRLTVMQPLLLMVWMMVLTMVLITEWLMMGRRATMTGESRDGDGGADGSHGGNGEENRPKPRPKQMNRWNSLLRTWTTAFGLERVDDGDVSELMSLLRRADKLEGFEGLEESDYVVWLKIVEEAGWGGLGQKYMSKEAREVPSLTYWRVWERLLVFNQFTLIWQLNQKMSKPVVQDEIFANLLQQPNHSKRHVVSKVIRQTNLTVTFYSANESKVRYCILATGNQDNFASSLYGESYIGHCTKEAAVEFCKLMEALNNDAFVVKGKPSKSKGEILPCERLDIVVNSILKDGKKVNAEKVISASYVYIVMIIYLGGPSRELILRSGMIISPPLHLAS